MSVVVIVASGSVPVNDADHAVLTVVGAVDAQLVQQVQQQHAEVAVELADSGFQAGVRLDGVHVLRQKLKGRAEFSEGDLHGLKIYRHTSHLGGQPLPLRLLPFVSLSRGHVGVSLFEREPLQPHALSELLETTTTTLVSMETTI